MKTVVHSPPKASLLIERLIELRMSSIKKWFTTKEAAAYLGRSEAAITNLVYRGKLVARKLGGRSYFNRDELDRAIQSSLPGGHSGR